MRNVSAITRKSAFIFLALGVALSAAFLVPVVPVTVVHSNSAICPPDTVGLCSIGDDSLALGAYGSPTYRFFGFGGVVWQGRFQLVQNGCHVTTFMHQSIQDLVCS